MFNRRVLLVDDEPDVLEILSFNLQQEGYEVYTAQDGKEAVEKARHYKPALILLDVMLPKQDGIETCRQLRGIPELRDAFIVFLTARGEEYTELAGFEAGADDYIVKPIRARALLSRLKALGRRSATPLGRLSYTDLEIVPDEHAVYVKGRPITLSKKEFELLYFLASKPYKIFSREQILDSVWGRDAVVIDRTVDVHIRKVREHIGEGYIQTVKGVGYKFVPEPVE
ncbi:MAG: response regulator [Bacteroidia bacterium]